MTVSDTFSRWRRKPKQAKESRARTASMMIGGTADLLKWLLIGGLLALAAVALYYGYNAVLDWWTATCSSGTSFAECVAEEAAVEIVDLLYYAVGGALAGFGRVSDSTRAGVSTTSTGDYRPAIYNIPGNLWYIGKRKGWW